MEACEKRDTVIPKETIAALVRALEKVPQGVVKMSTAMPGTVETSNNVGRVELSTIHDIWQVLIELLERLARGVAIVKSMTK